MEPPQQFGPPPGAPPAPPVAGPPSSLPGMPGGGPPPISGAQFGVPDPPLTLEFPEQQNIIEGERVPGAGKSTLNLSVASRQELGDRLEDIVDAYNQGMRKRWEREEDFLNAYDLIPDVKQGGQHPGASRMCSSMLRRYVNSTTARLASGMMDTRPWMKVEVSASNNADPDTLERMVEAEATQTFFGAYVDTMELPTVVPEEIQQQVLLGTEVTLIEWLPEEEEAHFFDEDGKLQSETRKHGRIVWTPIRNRNIVAWPLHEKDIRRSLCFGHRTYMLEAEFKDFFTERGVEKVILDEICAASGFHRSEAQEKDLERQEIEKPSHNPFDGQIEVYSLWCNFRLPGDTKPTKFLVFFHHRTSTVLWTGYNTLLARRPPYFRQGNWDEPNSFWGSGVGQETIYHQAADTAMWNMEIDNLKIVGNHVIQVPAGGEAEANTNEIYPGKVIVVDQGEEIQSIPMGGSLEELAMARQRNQQDGAIAAGVPSVLEGQGDPTMKSGATASAHQSLIAQASHRPGHIDRNMREAYSKKFMFCLLLLQQYAPDGVYYEALDPESAELMTRQKFRVPSGDLERNFRISVRSPSAATNREAQQQQVLLIWNFAKEQAQLMLQMGPQFFQEDQAGLQEALHDSGKLIVDTFKQIIELHDMKGLKAPEMDAPTPIEEKFNQLQQEKQQLEQQLQQMQQQLAGGGPPPPGKAPQSPPPGGPPGPPPAQPPGPPR